nr:putative ribonuclease H-like domain-containing protein [Tanacetum cinerariifolium]
DVIENRNSFIPAAQTTTNADGTSTTLIPGPVTTEEKVQKKNDVKLAILGENISQEDLSLKFLRSLPSEWNTHVVVWRNKPDLNTMSFDVLYNNFKIVEQEVKGNTSSSSSLISQNMAFVSSPSSTSEVNTAYRVSTTNTQVSTASIQVSTANLSDATVYAFLANQPNGSQLVHEDLVKIHEDDLEEMDLKWQTASKAMVAIDGASFNWSYMADDEVPTNMALMAFSDSELDLSNSGVEEFQQPEFGGYEPKTSNNISEDISNEVKESPDAPLVKELASNDKLEKKTVFHTVAKIKLLDLNNNKNQLGNQLLVNAVRENQGNLQLELQEKEVINSGCSMHMTGNMSYLSKYEEINGGYVAFGGDPKGGKITGKGKISTDIECVVLSPDFKLLDESQVLLRVPRKNNMYSVNLKNIAPSGGLTCLFAKATLDESNLWHKRLGHINFKTINKLVRGNLVRGLPSKNFENVACQKGKQHKASYKTKSVSSISQPLQMLHMDLFGPTFVKSIIKRCTA